MAKDYTNIQNSRQSAGGSPNKPETYICKNCYYEGLPIQIQKGSWPFFSVVVGSLLVIGLALSIFGHLVPWEIVAMLAIFVGLFCFYTYISRDDRDSSFMSLFNMPYSLMGCRECKHPNMMVSLQSKEGQDTLFWKNRDNMVKKDRDDNGF